MRNSLIGGVDRPRRYCSRLSVTMSRIPRVAPRRRRQTDRTGGFAPRMRLFMAPLLRPVIGQRWPALGRRRNSGCGFCGDLSMSLMSMVTKWTHRSPFASYKSRSFCFAEAQNSHSLTFAIWRSDGCVRVESPARQLRRQLRAAGTSPDAALRRR